MKKILAFVLASVMAASVFSMDMNIFKFVPVSGNVKNYTEVNYTIYQKFGEYSRVPNKKIVHTLNNVLNDLEITELTARDAVINRTVNSFDVYNNLTEQNCYDPDGNLLWRAVITYKDGLKSDWTEYDAEGNLKSKTIYLYTDNKLTDESFYDADGALKLKIIYKYDDEGRESVVSQYNTDGNLVKSNTYTYSDEGKVETVAFYDNLTKEEFQNVFRYGSTGNLSEITTYNAEKEIVQRTVVKLDSLGNVTKLSVYDIAQKFGTTVKELSAQTDYKYQ